MKWLYNFNSQRCTKSYVSNHSIVKKKETNHNSYRSLNIFPRDSDRDYSHYRRVNKYEVNRVCTRRLARMVERGPEAFLALFRSALAIILCSIDLVRRVAMVKKERKGNVAATGAQRRQDFTRGEEARRVQKGKETGFFSTPLRSYTCPVHPGLINKSLSSSSSSSSRLPLGPAFFESNIVFVPLSKRGIESLPLYLSYVLCEPPLHRSIIFSSPMLSS